MSSPSSSSYATASRSNLNLIMRRSTQSVQVLSSGFTESISITGCAQLLRLIALKSIALSGETSHSRLYIILNYLNYSAVRRDWYGVASIVHPTDDRDFIALFQTNEVLAKVASTSVVYEAGKASSSCSNLVFDIIF